MIRSFADELSGISQGIFNLRAGAQGAKFNQQFRSFQNEMQSSFDELFDDIGNSLDKLADMDLAKVNKSVDKIYKGMQAQRKLLLDDSGKINARNKIFRDTTADALKIYEKVLLAAKKHAAITKTYAEDAQIATQNWRKHFDNMSGSLDRMVNKVPLIGQYLSSSRLGLDKLADKMEEAFGQKLLDRIDSTSKGGKTAMLSMFSAAGSAAKVFGKVLMAALPVLAIIGLVTTVISVFKKAIGMWKEQEEAAENFRQSTGIFKSQMQGLPAIVQKVYLNTVRLGASYSDIYDSAAALTREWGHIRVLTEQNIQRLVVYNKGLGISDDVTAKAMHNLVQFGGATMEQAGNIQDRMIAQTLALGMSAQDVMGDLANISEDVAGWFGGYGKGLANAVIQARKLGVNLSTITGLAERFLDFESTIQSEMQLSAILGRRVSFQGAREAAFNNNAQGVLSEVLKQVGGTWNSSNGIIRKMIADATGISVGQMAMMMTSQKQFAQVPQAMQNVYKIIQNMPDDMKAVFNADQMQNSISTFQNTMQAMLQHIINPIVHLVSTQIPALMRIITMLVPSGLKGKATTIGSQASFSDNSWQESLSEISAASMKAKQRMAAMIEGIAGSDPKRASALMFQAQSAIPLMTMYEGWEGSKGSKLKMLDILRQAFAQTGMSGSDLDTMMNAILVGSGKEPVYGTPQPTPAYDASRSTPGNKALIINRNNQAQGTKLKSTTHNIIHGMGNDIMGAGYGLMGMPGIGTVMQLIANTTYKGLNAVYGVKEMKSHDQKTLAYEQISAENSRKAIEEQQENKKAYLASLKSDLANPMASIVKYLKYSTTLMEHLVNKQMVTALQYLFAPAALAYKSLDYLFTRYNPENASVYGSRWNSENKQTEWFDWTGTQSTTVAGRLSSTAGFSIPKMARGGLVKGNTVAMVGENGPEILSLPNQSTVIPLTSNRVQQALGDNTEIVSLLKELITAVQQGQIIEMDGQKLGKAISRRTPVGSPLTFMG